MLWDYVSSDWLLKDTGGKEGHGRVAMSKVVDDSCGCEHVRGRVVPVDDHHKSLSEKQSMRFYGM